MSACLAPTKGALFPVHRRPYVCHVACDPYSPLQRCESTLAGILALSGRVVREKEKWRATLTDAELLRRVASLTALGLQTDTLTRWPLALGFLLSARFILEALVSDLRGEIEPL